jgi:hypothetical protein
MNDYFLILTNIGKAKVAEAVVNNTKVNITNVAFGDGNGSVVTPTPAWTNLANEVYRAAPNSVGIHKDNDSWISVKAYIPKDVGSWFIREIGLYDGDDNLIAVGNYPDTYKPTLSLGVGVDMFIEVIMEVSDATAITLLIDASAVLATQEFVKEEIAKINVNTGVFAGMLSFCALRTLPAGWARLDGATFTSDNFPDIWTKLTANEFPTCSFAQYSSYLNANDGNCGYFGLDVANGKFRLPTIKDGNALTQAATNIEIGKWYRDAIRNIKGHTTLSDENFYYSRQPVDGVLFRSEGNGTGGTDGANGNGSLAYKITFDASRAVPTAEENRNKQVRYPIIICLVNEFVGDSSAVWNEFLNSLTAKANADLSNIPNNIDYVIETWKSGDSWYRKFKSGWIEQGGGPTKANPITLPVIMSNANYWCMASWKEADRDGNWDATIGAYPISATQLGISINRGQGKEYFWEAKGIRA